MTAFSLIEYLQNAALYDHPVHSFRVIETHISWVILTGDYVYKIKKPVNFGFLDFSTLEKRKQYCEEELHFNKTLAPALYEKIIPVYGSLEQPNLQGQGPVIEYMIKMREFPQDNLWNKLLEKNQLTQQSILDLARILANFHETTAHADKNSDWGTPEQIQGPTQQNFDQIREFLKEPSDLAQLDRLETWAHQQHEILYSVFQQRKAQGFIRECHGDVHLGNIVMQHNQQPTLFDAIEFNEEFRWTDVMADLGFIAMDLADHQHEDYAHVLINAYLEHTGDYASLAVLPYYSAYRAVVRAKIALFTLNPNQSADEQNALRARYRSCMALAERYAQIRKPTLMITHGLSGSGKSTLAKMIVEQFGAIQIRSDIERKRLQGLAADAVTHSALNDHAYHPNMTEKTYQHLADLAEIILKANYSVSVDATFLYKQQRDLFATLAQKLKYSFLILYTHAPFKTLLNTLQQRREKNHDPSEATAEVLAMQQASLEPLSAEELAVTLSIDTSAIKDRESLLNKLREHTLLREGRT